MKIKDLIIKNFAKVSEISVSFDKDLTYIIGENGSAKTTVGLNAVWFLIKGLSQKGDGVIAERFRFIGPHSKSANVIGNLYDDTGINYKISRKLLKNRTELKIEASDGRQLDQAWLDSIFNSFLIDPVGFSRLSGKEQALAFGADTASFDVKKKDLEIERRDIGRDVKRLQGVVDSAGNPEKINSVDVADLMAELTKRQDVNRQSDSARTELGDYKYSMQEHAAEMKGVSQEIENLEEEIIKLKNIMIAGQKEADDMAAEYEKRKVIVANLPDFDEQEIKDQIENAQEINQKATAYQQLLENEKALETTSFNYESKTDLIKKTEDDRNKYLKSLKLPWPNITITDEGEFRLNDKPFCSPYFSTGEILKFGARIGSKLKDGLKYVFFPSSNILDDKNRDNIIKTLVNDGFQVVLEYVGKERKKDTSILLKEMKVVESYDDNEGKGLK